MSRLFAPNPEVNDWVREIIKYMQKIDTFRKFNEIIKFGEDKLKMFHTVRSKVDSYKRAIHAIINKKVYQKCVDELQITHTMNYLLLNFK